MPGRRTAGSDRHAESAGNAYDRAATPVLALADDLAERGSWSDVPALLREARARIDRFGDTLHRAGLPAATLAPARLALGLVLDQAARSNEALPLHLWSPGAYRLLFEGEEMSPARLRDFANRADKAGPAFADTAAFLRRCLTRVEAASARTDAGAPESWGRLLAGAVLGFAALVLAWAVHTEWAFHRETAQAFAAEALSIGLDRPGAIADLGPRLDRMAAAVAGVERSLAKAPVRVFAGPLGFDAASRAREVQARTVRQHLPPVLAGAIETALASEGDSPALYDTVRAWDVLSGDGAWNPAYLQGWLTARRELLPDLQALAPHVGRLTPPFAQPPSPDPALLAQARVFAAETSEADRAWIELIRSPEMTALAPWRPSQVPGLAEIAVRRSGKPMTAAIPGAYTTRGWAYARDGGAAQAVEVARAVAARLYRDGLRTVAGSSAGVLARLQVETLATWRGFLDDLRVRRFDRRATAVRVSGLLARKPSPIALLLTQAWEEVGGTDRSRPRELQQRIAAGFGPMIQYVESGRLDEISALFASLNAALGARGASDDLITERLMGFQDRAASVAALRQAPPVVVQLVEDVLAQTAVPRAAQIASPFTQRWQAEVYDLCRRATEGRFPFDANGADADLADFAALFGGGGAIERFFVAEAQPYIDTSASPWRWLPEARFSGLSPESAELFEKAQAIRAGFFDDAGNFGATVTIAALAERGKAVVTLGGASAAVDARADAASLRWPGTQGAAGVSVAFAGQPASITEPGAWGFLRLLDGLRLRPRDQGQRFLVDLRSDAGRLFLELAFPSAANPVAGLSAARGFACPAAL